MSEGLSQHDQEPTNSNAGNGGVIEILAEAQASVPVEEGQEIEGVRKPLKRATSIGESEEEVEDLLPPRATSPGGAVDIQKDSVALEQQHPATEDAAEKDGDDVNDQIIHTDVPQVQDEESVVGKGENNEIAEVADGGETAGSLAVPSTVIRAASPSSRTSTPPLPAGSAPPVKKFSAVNVNKRFLSKTASPAASTPTGSTKFGSLTGRQSASPVPISSSSSRFLSTKLTTVSSSKSATSPQPLAPGQTPSSSPWAKPSVPTKDHDRSPSATLQQPIPTKGRMTSNNVMMGSGKGIGGSLNKTAWKAVASERRPNAGIGLARDFPTASEVAEGKKAAQVAAQAQAAHNQEILKGLNAFTQLGSDHRWDDEDDDDEVLDFGDGMVYPPHEHPDDLGGAPMEAMPVFDEPVTKDQRFVEDFDRSWPRRMAEVVPPPPSSATTALPRKPEGEGDRVLFNATSNRLEAPRRSAQPPAQPTRLLSRQSDSGAETSGRSLDRPLPPHMQSSQQPSQSTKPADPSRQLPPHMAILPQAPAHVSSQDSALQTGRQPWSVQKEAQQQAPGPAWRRPSTSAQSPPEVPAPPSSHPPRRSFGQSMHEAPQVSPQATASAASPTAATAVVDSQSQEMHAAAEKARLRRLAEEQEREAAADRARKKAKELEERFGPKQPTVSAEKTQPASNGPPGLAAPSRQITIAQRPKPADVIPSPSVDLSSKSTVAGSSPAKPVQGLAGLPQKPPADTRPEEGSWRAKTASGEVPTAAQTDQARAPSKAPQASSARQARPKAEAYFETVATTDSAHPPTILPSRSTAESHAAAQLLSGTQLETEPVVRLPQSPEKGGARKDQNFDSMLARLQAAMAEARVSPSQSSSKVDLPAKQSSPSLAQPKPSKDRPSPLPTSVVKEYFDVTQSPPPKSPLPAWRTYTVKLPRTSRPKTSIPSWRIQAFESPRKPSVRGWIMSFSPPLEDLNVHTLSRSEILVPRRTSRRFSRIPDPEPVVSISPRSLEPFQRKKKKISYEPSMSPEIIQPVMSSASLLGTAPVSSATAVLQAQVPAASKTKEAQSQSNWSAETHNDAYYGGSGRGKTRSPVKSSPAIKAEKQGAFNADGVVGYNMPERGRLPSDSKPGVRFMVSSELEGDSLLDEVNKMSLETVEEGTDHKADTSSVGDGRNSGSETPKTPPSLSATSSRGAHASSPNGTSTPWSKGSARSSSQHDHIRSMWDQPGSSSTEAVTSAATVESSAKSEASAPKSDPSTPLYPSLNAPSSSDPPAPRPINTSVKLPYSQSQTFSPTSTNPTSFGAIRQSASTGHFGYNQTPDQHNAIGLYARSPGNNAAVHNANGNFMQQNLWSPSAFGTGYGYTKAMSSMDQKAAMAFNSAQAQAQAQAQGQGHRQSGHAQAYQAKDSHGIHQTMSPVGGEYRYGGQSYGPSPYQSHAQIHAQAQALHRHSSSQSSQYGQSPYASSRTLSSPQQAQYSYGYGAVPSNQMNNAARARYEAVQSNGLSEYGTYSGAGGYYGGIGAQAASAGGYGYGAAMNSQTTNQHGKNANGQGAGVDTKHTSNQGVGVGVTGQAKMW